MPSYTTSSYGTPFRSSVTKWVRYLLIANTVVFVLVFLVPPFRALAGSYLVFSPAALLSPPWPVWGALTYAFTHFGIGHWFFNMLALFFFGPRLEDRWGSRDFLKYYLVAAAGGALFSLIDPRASITGASAAINGLLIAWAVYWPDEEVMFFGIFPIKIKWLVAIMGFISILSAMGPVSDGVAHLAHVGGFVVGFLYLRSPWGPKSWGDLPARRKPAKARAVVPWTGKKSTAAAGSPTAPTPAAAGSVRRTNQAERELLDDVDRILDKIREHGIASLTAEERARLEELSRRKRTN